MSTFNLGRILPMFKGTWSSSNSYNQLDIVYHDGSSYVAKNSVTSGGNNPSINNNWQIVAMKGELSPTLTPEQEAYIINAIMNQGVVIDPDYNHTDNNFTNTYRDAVDNIGNINFGTLTLKRNNVPVGTFTSDTNSTININVPTSASQLTDNNTIQRTEEAETVMVEGGIADVNVKPNTWIVVDGICSQLNINLEIDITNINTWNQPVTHIVVTPDDGMSIDNTSGMMTAVEIPPVFSNGEMYLITIKGGIIIRFSKLNTI